MGLVPTVSQYHCVTLIQALNLGQRHNGPGTHSVPDSLCNLNSKHSIWDRDTMGLVPTVSQSHCVTLIQALNLGQRHNGPGTHSVPVSLCNLNSKPSIWDRDTMGLAHTVSQSHCDTLTLNSNLQLNPKPTTGTQSACPGRTILSSSSLRFLRVNGYNTYKVAQSYRSHDELDGRCQIHNILISPRDCLGHRQ